MIGPLLARLAAGEHLHREQAMELAELLVAGEVSDAQIGAALMGLAANGASAEELAGLATALRARAMRVTTRHQVFIDTAGTGGDGANTFNISTAAAFVIAAAGLPVAKHGNRAASSRCGSADVLAALGARIEVTAEQASRHLDELGICFMFAPAYHQATRRVAEIRRQLGIRTAFNFVGPLTSPAGAPRQLIGVGSASMLDTVAEAVALLGIERAWIVHGDGLDEVTVTGPTEVIEVRNGSVERRFNVDLGPLNLPTWTRADLAGGDVTDNARLVRGVLDGVTGAARDVVLLNAAAALVIGELANDLESGLRLAAEAIDSGAAAELLERFVVATQECAG
jgi:anthranilate phosphoribosyltransferase